jgi:hypothetical protein
MSTAKLVAEATCAHKQSAQTAYYGFLDILRDLERGSDAGKDPDWEGMTVVQLKPICTQHQLGVSGSKHDLIVRLITAGVQFPNVANATGSGVTQDTNATGSGVTQDTLPKHPYVGNP